MSSTREFLVALLYSLPLALLALSLTNERYRPRWLVISILVLLPAFYIGHYRVLSALQGWPSDAALPDQFKLVAYDAVEPDKKTNTPGHILLWARQTDAGEPRVYRLAYTTALHQELVAAGERQNAGKQQLGRRTPPTTTAQQSESGDAVPSFRFRDEEPPALPEKSDSP